MEKDIVDILLATYNTNIDYLKQQLDSILNQTYKELNIIISDDASTNQDIKNLLKEYKEKDNRITLYLQEKNLGYIKNFEFLLEKSTAEYVAFSDHDDIWYEDKIENCIKELKEKEVDLVYSDCKQIDKDGHVLQESYMEYKNLPKLNLKNNILTFSRHIAIGCSQVFTKKIKEQILPFDETVMAHDWITVYLANKQNGVFYIDKPLFDYRLHNTNEFGGRSLKQNLSRWKNENGKTYKAYKKYRNERVIKKAYLDGTLMCKKYRDKLNLNKDENEEKVINYYEKLLKTKVFNIHLKQYNNFLSYKGIGKRKIKEKMIFHFPLISYLVYLLK